MVSYGMAAVIILLVVLAVLIYLYSNRVEGYIEQTHVRLNEMAKQIQKQVRSEIEEARKAIREEVGNAIDRIKKELKK